MEVITSRRNPVCVHIKKLGISRSYREQSGEFLCDGLKLLAEAVKSNATIPVVLASSDIPFPLPLNTRLFRTKRDLIDSLSKLKNAQNVLFTCKIPQKASAAIEAGTHILLDGVQDPGNVGTIIRTASAFNIKSVILAGDCADQHNPKVIRSTMGAIFRLPVHQASIEELATLKSGGIRIIGAALSDDCRDFTEVSFNDSIIAIGREGCGLSDSILSLCDEKITIPISPECNSLNAAVAAGIIMHFSASGRTGMG